MLGIVTLQRVLEAVTGEFKPTHPENAWAWTSGPPPPGCRCAPNAPRWHAPHPAWPASRQSISSGSGAPHLMADFQQLGVPPTTHSHSIIYGRPKPLILQLFLESPSTDTSRNTITDCSLRAPSPLRFTSIILHLQANAHKVEEGQQSSVTNILWCRRPHFNRPRQGPQ